MGMCIIDMHRLYRNKLNEKYSDVDILEFSDLICKKLIVRSRRQNGRLALCSIENTGALERITDKNGNNRFLLTKKQETRGKNVGRSIHKNCFICCKYLTPTGETEYIQTTFHCSDCKMPLCKNDRSNIATGRLKNCLDEHIETTCEVVGCFGSDLYYTNFSRDKQVQLITTCITHTCK